MLGHQEYDKGTLAGEYFRDVDKGLKIDVPKNYFRNDDPEEDILFRWRSHASLLFSNWLNYYVYQDTPYDTRRTQEQRLRLSRGSGVLRLKAGFGYEAGRFGS